MQSQNKRGRPKGKTVATVTAYVSIDVVTKLSNLPSEQRSSVILRAIDTMESIPIGRNKRSLVRNSNMACYAVPIEYAEKFATFEARSFRFEQALIKIIEE